MVPIVTFFALLLEEFRVALFDVGLGGLDFLAGGVRDGDLADFLGHEVGRSLNNLNDGFRLVI